MNTSLEMKPRSISDYTNKNPKIKIIEMPNNQNQTYAFDGKRGADRNYYDPKKSNQSIIQNNTKAQIKVQDFGTSMSPFIQCKNQIQSFGNQQIPCVQKNPFKPNDIYEKQYKAYPKQNITSTIREEKSQFGNSVRSVSEYKAPTQNQQNNQLQQYENSKLFHQNPNVNKFNIFQSNYMKKQDSQINKDSQMNQEQLEETNIFESKVFTRQVQCYTCLQNIDGTQYQLNCQHIYHISCLQELISTQIKGFKQNPQLSCICKQKIHRIPKIDAEFNEIHQKELLQKQIEFIFYKNQQIFQTCNRCNFFWINKQSQKNYNAKQCCMCDEK
ncbi:unnamed protein product (macronuclear) [Paramecium tetraurelia]|uniref:RING-type domain-containing protein n=1 Tax=Paramecium tetraurelia TaxID=5888 RepID=A0C4D3_PARTE|nr:uncharacterized protein GSPATT00035130001 [Paramecium tetraurelia]CAK65650.1 unnamed protein product [Paramecium tetraurelia]|eukprot:XP_001433047.1 hypothetical protein (macronuclear) [Paramecium tetraurelia strain d4-2]